ncbi:MAG: extracellular solute-binding protein [Chloroflexi bacterium]|nr:extracellular solute-binding protein [Chloroflexota bacterium]
MKFFASKIVLICALVALLVAPLMVTAQDNVELVLWHARQDAEGDALLALIDAFEAANPNITVEQVFNPSGTIQDSFRAAVGSGEGPDMIIWANDSAGEWATANLILNIDDMIDDELRAQATESAWGTATFEGAVWGIPFSAKTLTLFYNRALVPDAPETWDDVLEISEELALDGLTGLAFQDGFFHSAGFLYSLGGNLLDEDGNADFAPDTEGRAAFEAYLQFHQDMYNLGQDPDSGVIIDGSSPLPGFQTGEVAMVYDGIWNLAQFESDLGDDLGVALMPALDNDEVPALFAQTDVLYASANVADDEAKQDAFLAFSRFMTSEVGQQINAAEGGLLPVNPNVTVDSENLQVFAEQFALGTPFPNRAELSRFWGPMDDAIDAVGLGGLTPAEAAEEAYDLIQSGIDELRGDA